MYARNIGKVLSSNSPVISTLSHNNAPLTDHDHNLNTAPQHINTQSHSIKLPRQINPFQSPHKPIIIDRDANIKFSRVDTRSSNVGPKTLQKNSAVKSMSNESELLRYAMVSLSLDDDPDHPTKSSLSTSEKLRITLEHKQQQNSISKYASVKNNQSKNFKKHQSQKNRNKNKKLYKKGHFTDKHAGQQNTTLRLRKDSESISDYFSDNESIDSNESLSLESLDNQNSPKTTQKTLNLTQLPEHPTTLQNSNQTTKKSIASIIQDTQNLLHHENSNPNPNKNFHSKILDRSHFYQNANEKLNLDLELIKNDPSILHAETGSIASTKTNSNSCENLTEIVVEPSTDKVNQTEKLTSLPKNQIYTVGCGFSKRDNPMKIISDTDCINSKNTPVKNFGEDAAFIYESNQFTSFGVSDGVGGWKNYGVDSSKFSFSLVSAITSVLDLISVDEKSGDLSVDLAAENLNIAHPKQILTEAYTQIKNGIPNLIGSGTASLATFDKEKKILYTSNLGDSGIVVIRNNQIIFKSESMQHNFNAPYQLSLIPEEFLKLMESRGENLGKLFGDSPLDSKSSEIELQNGDIIIVASDGVFDNVHLPHLISLLNMMKINEKLVMPEENNNQAQTPADTNSHLTPEFQEHVRQELAKAATTIVAFARENAYNSKYLSPFCLEAQKFGFKNMVGGKVDDISLVMGIVGSS